MVMREATAISERRACQLFDRVIVAVAADGRYAVNKAAVDGKGVDAVARALGQAAGAGRDSVVIISADAMSPHQSVVTVMEAARRVGLTQITFATQSSASGRAASR